MSAPALACPACAAPLDSSAREPLCTLTCPQCGATVPPENSFDHFTIVETLGVGGMGSVYKARDTRLDRFVALKLLRRELSADPAEAALLEQEARLTAAINHPHVIQVYSAGHAREQLYLVMELVAHGSLDDLIAEGARVPENDILRTGLQIARGLQAAHEKGLIHRDVKPANILFAHPDTAKISDFGLAIATGQDAEAAREIWGTPYYVAPERLNNEPEDFRSDIYSLGATLFHALAGRPPIEGETTSASELRKLKNHPPDLRQLVPEISPATASVIQQMIAPDPAHRFRSYAQLIAALEHATKPIIPKTRSRAPLIVLVLVLVLAALYLAPRNKAPVPILPAPSASPPAALPIIPPPAADAEANAAAEKARAQEERELLTREAPTWQKALAEAQTQIARYDFPAALAPIHAAPVTAPFLLRAQSNERQKIEWLIAWKTQLIADLNAKRFQAEVPINQITYLGAEKADPARITFRLPFGTAPVEWTRIPAQTLLQISLSVFKPDAPDAPERNWLAAAFAAATGQPEAARPLARAAAEARPAYREQLPLLLPE